MIKNIIQILNDTFINFFADIVGFLPKLITGIIILGVGIVLAKLVRRIVSRVADTVGLNSVFENAGFTNGLQKMNIKASPAELVGSIISWILLLNFSLAALYAMDLRDVASPLEAIIASIPSIIAGLITFILGVMLAQFIGRLVSGAAEGIGIDFHEMLGSLVQLLMIGGVSIIAIQQMGLPAQVLQDLFVNLIAIITIGAALAFGLGGRSVAQNVLAGFYSRDLFTPGDTIVLDGEEGTLEGIGTLNTEVRVGTTVMVVPNTRLTEGTVIKKG